ncbi:hypothetical protein DSL92_05385 [Billgrantia gudaonensis]|uniref:Uncharacterized protein n=1 Tax=Billgrantia gudaonensis TaxID=376427 RepID=A0A432JJP1_9GAMM|nr:hypothetical protein DSL92_05385 [Halomonas gudaonensis]
MMDELASVDDAVSELDYDDGEDISDQGTTDAAQSAANDAPIVKFVNKVLLDAIRRGASDITSNPTRPATGCACASTAC